MGGCYSAPDRGDHPLHEAARLGNADRVAALLSSSQATVNGRWVTVVGPSSPRPHTLDAALPHCTPMAGSRASEGHAAVGGGSGRGCCRPLSATGGWGVTGVLRWQTHTRRGGVPVLVANPHRPAPRPTPGCMAELSAPPDCCLATYYPTTCPASPHCHPPHCCRRRCHRLQGPALGPHRPPLGRPRRPLRVCGHPDRGGGGAGRRGPQGLDSGGSCWALQQEDDLPGPGRSAR